MTSNPGWMPAPRPGIIPLHPLTFGTILSRSFAALRHNPKVLLGFALVVLSGVYLLLIVGVGAVTVWAVARTETVQPGTDDYEAITAGSVLIVGLSSLLMSLVATALQVIVQGVVVTETAHAAVAERQTLGALWRRVRPVAWRLIGYALLVGVVVGSAVVLLVIGLIAIGAAGLGGLAVVLTILLLLGAVPLSLWLSTKLLLVPSSIILERATIRQGIVRSWQLTRGRFWPALGIIVVINLAFGVAGQIVSIPFSLLGTAIGGIFAPTGDLNVQGLTTLILSSLVGSAIVLLIQAIAIIVQSTAAALVYIDCRMRREALDIDLLAYVEARDAGQSPLADPWTLHVGREVVRPPAAPVYPAAGYQGYPMPGYAGPAQGYPQPYGTLPQGYAQPGYVQPGYPQPGYAQPGYAQPGHAQPGYAQPGHAQPGYETPDAPAPPAPTQWAAPGERPE